MKDKTSFNNYHSLENKNSPDEYSIPEREVKTWCSFMERGFRDSRTMPDIQSGTHTETSADAIEEKSSMNKLQTEELCK